MKFEALGVAGAFRIMLEKRSDDRGFFARLFCEQQFKEYGLRSHYPQINTSASVRSGLLRGLHFQLPPRAEAKMMRCVKGSIKDIIFDLRPDSPTFLKGLAVDVSAEDRNMVYIPPGCAHGHLSVTPDCEVIYMTSEVYAPDHERGMRWNDPLAREQLGISVTEVSDKDRLWPDVDPNSDEIQRLRGLL